MRIALIWLLVACQHPTITPPTRTASPDIPHDELAADDEPAPAYGKAELATQLTSERAAIARLEQRAAELVDDALAIALADLAVRRRFVATLELCAASRRACPPRLDERAFDYAIDGTADPKLDIPLRFDRDDWQKVTAELHGRACACRTLACIDRLDAAILALEDRPMPEIRLDDTAVASITRARTCLMRLRGKNAIPKG